MAFKLGFSETDKTAAASFRVLNKEGKPVFTKGVNKKFRKSKREKGVYIEKRKHRISSLGEFRQITAKGILSSKNRRKKKLL